MKKTELAPEPQPILVFFAMDMEAGYFEDKLADQKRVEANGFRLVKGIHGGRTFIVVKTGAGRKRMAHAADAVCRAHRPEYVISAGYAGALVPELPRETLIFPTELRFEQDVFYLPERESVEFLHRDLRGITTLGGRLVTVDKPALSPQSRAALAANSGASSVDMETFALAVVCAELNLPLVAIRAVSDAFGDEIPTDIQKLLGQTSKTGQLGAAAALMWRRPAAFKQLCALRQTAMVCSMNLAQAVLDTVASASPDTVQVPTLRRFLE